MRDCNNSSVKFGFIRTSVSSSFAPISFAFGASSFGAISFAFGSSSFAFVPISFATVFDSVTLYNVAEAG